MEEEGEESCACYDERGVVGKGTVLETQSSLWKRGAGCGRMGEIESE